MTRIGPVDLVTRLRHAGDLPTDWEAAFATVDRAEFVPHQAWFDDEDGIPQPIEYGTEEWSQAIYSDEPVVTQLDEGRVLWPRTSRLVTSSASQPSIVLRMLDALKVERGHTVLEIGTGTGYNAAILAARLGNDRITTIEIDPAVAGQARTALYEGGHPVTVIVGDGADGYPPHAPYDRIISTAAVLADQVPHAWVGQTRPGGLILTPWGTTYRNGALLRLTVHDHDYASGTVIGDSAFMRLRQHTAPFGHAARFAELVETHPSVKESTTTTPPAEIGEDPDATTAIGLMLPGVQRSIGVDDPEHWEILLYDVGSESAALANVTPEAVRTGIYPVRQYGPRKLWDEAETGCQIWRDAGRPQRTRLGLTIVADQQWTWIDTPETPIRPLGGNE